MSALRRVPSAIAVSSAASLLLSAPPTAEREIGFYVLIVSAALWLAALLPTGRQWALRTASGATAGAALGLAVAAGPGWISTLAALLPVSAAALYFGPPFSINSGPGWARFVRGPTAPARIACLVDAYILLALAAIYQFVDSRDAASWVSVVLSVTAALGIFAAGGGGARTVSDFRVAVRIAGFAAQVHLAGVPGSEAVRIATGVAAAVYSVPATL